MMLATKSVCVLRRVCCDGGLSQVRKLTTQCVRHQAGRVKKSALPVHFTAPAASANHLALLGPCVTGDLHRDWSWHSLLLSRGTHDQGDQSAFSGAPTQDIETSLSEVEFEQVCEDALDSLAEVFEDLADTELTTSDFDVQLASGVLTVKLGNHHGTYVINKQTPNKQIWLSSPTSGPKRYDYIDGTWVYKRDGRSLHQLLTEEISTVFNQHIDFLHCVYGQKSAS